MGKRTSLAAELEDLGSLLPLRPQSGDSEPAGKQVVALVDSLTQLVLADPGARLDLLGEELQQPESDTEAPEEAPSTALRCSESILSYVCAVYTS